jgi:hypothetical protein
VQGRQRAELLLGEGEGAFVFGADGVVKQAAERRLMVAETWPSSAISACSEQPALTSAVA